MTTDRLDRIDLLIHRLSGEIKSPADERIQDILELMAEQIRYLHLRPAHQQLADSCGLPHKEN